MMSFKYLLASVLLCGCAAPGVQQIDLHQRNKAMLEVGGLEQYQGSIDREAIRVVIRKNLSGFKKCYTDELKTDPSVHGRLVVEFEITDTGKVNSAKTKQNKMVSKNVENSTATCANELLKKLIFPTPAKGTVAIVI